MPVETQLTFGPGGRILTNSAIWSPDSNWIAFDNRTDEAGSLFNGTTLHVLNASTLKQHNLYQSPNSANCGVVMYHPRKPELVFIQGPEYPTREWSYSASRRQGMLYNTCTKQLRRLDARDLTPPFTPGALRGGTHVHQFHPSGQVLSSTYEDEHLASLAGQPNIEANQRTIAIHWLGHPVKVPATHPRNHDGESFSYILTRTVDNPTPGSDEINRACEEAWIGNSFSLAFQGQVKLSSGEFISEVFLVDTASLPVAQQSWEAFPNKRLQPPTGCVQRRLTNTSSHQFPGLAGPRHWLRSNPQGQLIGCLFRDDAGISQFCTVSLTGELHQITFGSEPVQSCFTWHPDGERVALVRGNSICLVNVKTGQIQALTEPTNPPPRPEACVISPDGERIAFVRNIDGVNQIFTVTTS